MNLRLIGSRSCRLPARAPRRPSSTRRAFITDRLNRLVEERIFERVRYQERAARYEYRLSQKGSDLLTALNALRQWGDQERPLSQQTRSSSYRGQASRAKRAAAIRLHEATRAR
jgi:hypothetical protein